MYLGSILLLLLLEYLLGCVHQITIVVEFRRSEWIEWLIELLTVAMKRMMWKDLLLYNNIRETQSEGVYRSRREAFTLYLYMENILTRVPRI